MTTLSPSPATTRTHTTTRGLLTCAAVASPLWAATSLAQAAVRDGFDLTRHPLSALSNGSFGWVQITNFVLAGALFMAGATGMRQALLRTPGGSWLPRLVRVAGLGMVASGVLVMDPMGGFPAGAPTGKPEAMSWHSIGHLLAGTLSFAAFIIVCFVLGHHFRRTGRRDLGRISSIAGSALLVGDAWAMSGSSGGPLALALGAITAMTWVSAVAARLRRS